MANDPLWIEHMHMKKGALHSEMHIPKSEKIPMGKLRKAAKAGGKMGKRAKLALTLQGFNKG